MARRNQPRGRPDGCAVETRTLSPIIREYVEQWNREHPDLAGGASIDHRDARGRLAGNEVVSAVTILHERTLLTTAYGGRPVTRDAISNILRGRTRHTELWVADALLAAADRIGALADGTVTVVPNPSASRKAQADCCGGGLTGAGTPLDD